MEASKRWNIWFSIRDKHYEFLNCQFLNDWPDIIIMHGGNNLRFALDAMGNLNIHHAGGDDGCIRTSRPDWFDCSRAVHGSNNS